METLLNSPGDNSSFEEGSFSSEEDFDEEWNINPIE